MTAKQPKQSDAPTALQTVSDENKSRAISAAILSVAGAKVKTTIERIDYSGLMFDRGPFWRPTRIGFNLAIDSDNDDRAHLVARLQATDDQSLANAIADNIGKLAGETYRAAISSKSFSKLRSSRHTSNEIGRVSILVALAAAGGT